MRRLQLLRRNETNTMRQLNKVLQITRRDRQTRFRSAKKNNRQELKSPGRPRKPPKQKTMHTRSVWRRKERRLRKSTWLA